MSSQALPASAVKKIAHLARLSQNPTEEFLNKYGEDLGAILSYVEELKEVDTFGVSALNSRIIQINELREDEFAEDNSIYQKVRQNIINNFPNKQNNLLVIPSIFE